MRLGTLERGSRLRGQAVPYADCAMPGTANWRFSDAITFKFPEAKLCSARINLIAYGC